MESVLKMWQNLQWSDDRLIFWQTLEQLCQVTGDKLEDVKKKLEERKAKGKGSQKKEEEDTTPQKGSRMKTAEEVVKRIKWDSQFDPDDFMVTVFCSWSDSV